MNFTVSDPVQRTPNFQIVQSDVNSKLIRLSYALLNLGRRYQSKTFHMPGMLNESGPDFLFPRVALVFSFERDNSLHYFTWSHSIRAALWLTLSGALTTVSSCCAVGNVYHNLLVRELSCPRSMHQEPEMINEWASRAHQNGILAGASEPLHDGSYCSIWEFAPALQTGRSGGWSALTHRRRRPPCQRSGPQLRSGTVHKRMPPC